MTNPLIDFLTSHFHYVIGQRYFEDLCRQIRDSPTDLPIQGRQELVDESCRVAVFVSDTIDEVRELVQPTIKYLQKQTDKDDALLNDIAMCVNNLEEDKARADAYTKEVVSRRIGTPVHKPRRPQIANPFIGMTYEEYSEDEEEPVEEVVIEEYGEGEVTEEEEITEGESIKEEPVEEVVADDDETDDGEVVADEIGEDSIAEDEEEVVEEDETEDKPVERVGIFGRITKRFKHTKEEPVEDEEEVVEEDESEDAGTTDGEGEVTEGESIEEEPVEVVEEDETEGEEVVAEEEPVEVVVADDDETDDVPTTVTEEIAKEVVAEGESIEEEPALVKNPLAEESRHLLEEEPVEVVEEDETEGEEVVAEMPTPKPKSNRGRPKKTTRGRPKKKTTRGRPKTKKGGSGE